MNTIDEETLNANLAEIVDSPADIQKAEDEATGKQATEAKEATNVKPQTHDLGMLQHMPGKQFKQSEEEAAEFRNKVGIGTVGENIFAKAEMREGWVDVDKRLMGERANFYPEGWQFRIKPADVEAIRNWSMIDNENPNVVDDVFNEVLKSCLAIVTPNGAIPWNNIRSWDRFYFLLLIREYTFIKGERKVEYTEECPSCEAQVTFELKASNLMYDMPDPDIMKYFSTEDQTWVIDPAEYDVEGYEPITLYLPTLDKDANIKAWLIDRYQNKKKINNVFIKFLPWLAPSISKDLTIAQRQIRDYEVKFKSWDTEMFDFMNEVVTNIMVQPSTKLIARCAKCGEEVTSDIRFPNGINDLFNISSGRKKFGNK